MPSFAIINWRINYAEESDEEYQLNEYIVFKSTKETDRVFIDYNTRANVLEIGHKTNKYINK